MATEQQQPKVMWPFYIEEEANFSPLAMLSTGLAIVSYFYCSRLVVMLSVLVFALSIPHKQKVDLNISGILMSGLPVIAALTFAYVFRADSYA